MKVQLRNLLIVGGVLSIGYYAFNKLTTDTLSLKDTNQILRQIKHQILIQTINSSDVCNKALTRIKDSNPSKYQATIEQFRAKFIQIYNQKQELVLNKNQVSKQKYAASLKIHHNNVQITRNTKQIIEMMQKAANGESPDLSVNGKIRDHFNKEMMKVIYENMSKMILILVINKLQDEKRKNPTFDSTNDALFKKAIRQLSLFSKKVTFFQSQGFLREWGCPNENFFKYNQALKRQDQNYKKQMNRVQTIYQQIVDKVTRDPHSVKVQNLNDYFIVKPQPKVERVERIERIERVEKVEKGERVDPFARFVNVLHSKEEKTEAIVHYSSSEIQDKQAQGVLQEQKKQIVELVNQTQNKQQVKMETVDVDVDVVESQVSELKQQLIQNGDNVEQTELTETITETIETVTETYQGRFVMQVQGKIEQKSEEDTKNNNKEEEQKQEEQEEQENKPQAPVEAEVELKNTEFEIKNEQQIHKE